MSSVALGYSPANTDSQGAPLPTVVTAYGAKGDGTTDDTTAIQAALDASHAVDFPDGKTFLISSTLMPQSNSVLRFHGNATLKAKVKAWADAAMIDIDGLSNVRIEGGTLDGDKANNSTGRVMGVKVLNDASNVTLIGVRAIDMPGQDATGINGGDGFYIGGTTGTPDTVSLIDCIADGNVRQGLSIVAGTHVRVYGGAYRNTSGSAPGDGIDIEPNASSDIIEDVQIIGAALTDNGGSGVQIIFSDATGDTQRGIRIMSCPITGNASHGVNVDVVRDLELYGCDVSGNTLNGIDLGSDASTNVAVIGGRLSLNGARGIAVTAGADTTVSGIALRGVRIQDNSQTTSGSTHGVFLTATASGASITGVVIDGCTIGNLDGTTQSFGLSISAGVSHLQLTNNDLRGNSGGAAALLDDAATRVSSGNLGLSTAVGSGTAAPTTGTWAKGDVVWNTSPAAAKPVAWVCTAAGTPGTWVPSSRLPSVSSDRGNTDVTLTVGTDATTQLFLSNLSAARTITLSTTGAVAGDTFRIVRSGYGSGTLAVGSLKTIPAGVAAVVDVEYNGTAWVLTGCYALDTLPAAVFDAGNSSTAITLTYRADRQQQKVTLTGNATITLASLPSGAKMRVYVNTGAGSFTATWAATSMGSVLWFGGTAPTVTTTASKVDVFEFTYDGTNVIAEVVGQNA